MSAFFNRRNSVSSKTGNARIIEGFVAGALLVVVAGGAIFMYYMSHRNDADTETPTAATVETATERNERLAIMNILNQFQLDQVRSMESEVDDTLRRAKSADRMKGVSVRLTSLQNQGSFDAAVRDLSGFFSRWATVEEQGQDVEVLKDDVGDIIESYPWLETLFWTMLLNRL